MQNIVFFTICSANYLAHAKTLGESVRRYHPETRFIIGLVDRIPSSLPPSFLDSWEVLPVEHLAIEGFDDMAARYNVVELNTAVKPFYLENLYDRPEKPDAVIFIDPDIVLFARMDTVLGKLRTHHLIFTPHSCTPNDSTIAINFEQGMLSTGIYNLGFIATSRSDATRRFLRWWQKRLFDHCYYRPGTGLFVDQIWAILAPVYFESSHIERDPGHNMAYWNLFERQLTRAAGGYIVNDTRPLVFFHFSNYNPDRPENLTNRSWPAITPTFSERSDLVPLFEEYRAALLRNGYHTVHTLKCQLDSTSRPSAQPPYSMTKRLAAKALVSLPSRARRVMKRTGDFLSRHCST